MFSFKKMTDEFDVTKNILIVGEKIKRNEEIIETFAKNFSKDFKGLITGGTEVEIKVGEKNVKLFLYTPRYGKEYLKKIWIQYSAVIFVYDITDRNSFEALEGWIQNVEYRSKSIPKIIVGTNLENVLKEEVNEDQSKEFAEQNHALSYLMETNNAISINQIFSDIISNFFRIEGPIQKKDSFSNYKATTKSKEEEDEQEEDEQAKDEQEEDEQAKDEQAKDEQAKDEQAEHEQEEVVEVILFGGQNSGKSDILNAYFNRHNSVYNQFYGSITVKVGNKFVNLIIKEGSYRMELLQASCTNSSAVAFVYNTNDKKTFYELNEWFKAMNNIKPELPKAIIGNKVKVLKEEVSKEELENLAKENNIKFYKVVSNENIIILDELFINLVKEVLQQRQSANYRENENDENDGEIKGQKNEGNGCCLIV